MNPTYICSLSRAGNLLSQWRGYGLYAIEFDEEQLLREIPSIRECIYDSKEQRTRADLAMTKAITSISNCIDENDCMGLEGFDALTKLWELAATFKDDGFAEERELRIVKRGVDDAEVQYRVRNNMLVPYVELGFSLDCIKAVHIGPMNERELALKSFRGFADQIEKQWQEESSNIEYWIQVLTSTIPFRTI